MFTEQGFNNQPKAFTGLDATEVGELLLQMTADFAASSDLRQPPLDRPYVGGSGRAPDLSLPCGPAMTSTSVRLHPPQATGTALLIGAANPAFPLLAPRVAWHKAWGSKHYSKWTRHEVRLAICFPNAPPPTPRSGRPLVAL